LDDDCRLRSSAAERRSMNWLVKSRVAMVLLHFIARSFWASFFFYRQVRSARKWEEIERFDEAACGFGISHIIQ